MSERLEYRASGETVGWIYGYIDIFCEIRVSHKSGNLRRYPFAMVELAKVEIFEEVCTEKEKSKVINNFAPANGIFGLGHYPCLPTVFL